MGLKTGETSFFRVKLLEWHATENRRQMPWKGIRDPYRIWLSEVILQQTRVEQGLSYYERFVSAYPSVLALAQAPDDEVFKIWEGLGYYSRCRNLLKTARFIAYELGGVFPSTYPSILALSGVGPYTAAAIASFAFSLPHAVVDGNVIRVLSRVFGIDEPVDDASVRKKINLLADELLDRGFPAAYNQALMDFGATVCKPRAPRCEICPLAEDCQAFRTGRVDLLPVKGKKLVRKKRFLHYIIIEQDNKVFVRKRDGNDIWKGLFEFYLVEDDRLMTPEELLETSELKKITGRKKEVLFSSDPRKQQLTHQELNGIFVHLRLEGPPKGLEGYHGVGPAALRKLAFPRFISSYLEENSVNLNSRQGRIYFSD